MIRSCNDLPLHRVALARTSIHRIDGLSIRLSLLRRSNLPGGWVPACRGHAVARLRRVRGAGAVRELCACVRHLYAGLAASAYP